MKGNRRKQREWAAWEKRKEKLVLEQMWEGRV